MERAKYTPRSEQRAEIINQIRFHKSFLKELEKQLRLFDDPPKPHTPASSFKDFEALAESLSNRYHDTMSPKPY